MKYIIAFVLAVITGVTYSADYVIPTQGKTHDGKYPIYQIDGMLNDINYGSKVDSTRYQPSDLLGHMVYLNPQDVGRGYACDFVCKDDQDHIVGLNPQVKWMEKKKKK